MPHAATIGDPGQEYAAIYAIDSVEPFRTALDASPTAGHSWGEWEGRVSHWSRLFYELLAAHESARNERVRPMYEFTTHLAALEPPPPEMQALFGALRGNQDATNAFLSAITGAIPISDFMSNENIGRIIAAAKDVEIR